LISSSDALPSFLMLMIAVRVAVFAFGAFFMVVLG
jgi:hypothetical protein